MSTWGDWEDGIEYWASSEAQRTVRWDYSLGTADDPYIPASDATAAARWDDAVTAFDDGTVLSVAPAQVFRLGIQANYDEADLSQVVYLTSNRQFAYGFSAFEAEHSLPDLTETDQLPPGAVSFEYEAGAGQYLDGARLNLYDYFLELLAVDVEMQVRAVPGMAAEALAVPVPYDGDGPVLVTIGAVAETPGPLVVDVTAYTTPGSGDFVVTTAPHVVSWTPPTVEDPFRGADGDFRPLMEYRCLTPRIRFLYDELPPEAPEAPTRTGLPPQRLHPRDDRSAVRTAPSSAARQRSNRVIGGYL